MHLFDDVRTIRVVSMHPVTRLVQCVNSMAMAADNSLLGARPSEGAVLCLHKAHPQALGRVGDEAPEVGQLIRFIHVCDACQVQPPHQLPESRSDRVRTPSQTNMHTGMDDDY